MTELLPDLDVSRETYDRLTSYVDLLKKWNPKINLVSKSTLELAWSRHILDSAQIFQLAPPDAMHWVDMGCGGGFPGAVIAILAHEISPEMKVTLIESDQRKCAFLRTVMRETGCNAHVLASRIEGAEPQRADVLSARALADLTTLCQFAERHLSEGGIALFPKGLTWEKEVSEAQDSWSFDLMRYTSETDENAVVLKLQDIKHD